MKILLLGDASNYHYTLGRALSRLGHDVTVASSGMRWQDTQRDIDLKRRPGKIGGAFLWLKLNTVLASRLKGYDVVQIVNPIFLDLRPNRNGAIFKRLKRDNGAVYLTALGTDTAYVETCLAADNPLRFSEWNVEGRPTPFTSTTLADEQRTWLRDPLLSHTRRIYDNIDGVVTALYEYHAVMQRYFPADMLAYGGIPVDVEAIPFRPPTGRLPLTALSPFPLGREPEKGIDQMRDIFGKIDGLNIVPVGGVSYKEFLKRLENCDIVLDQFYAHSPATTALLAMAMGKTVVTGASPDFRAFIGEDVPALNISPLDTTSAAARIQALLSKTPEDKHKALLTESGEMHLFAERGEKHLFDGSPETISETMLRFGADARDFVRRHNDSAVVARRFLSLWQR